MKVESPDASVHPPLAGTCREVSTVDGVVQFSTASVALRAASRRANAGPSSAATEDALDACGGGHSRLPWARCSANQVNNGNRHN